MILMGNDINSLSGIEFENLCQQLIEKMNFTVETTKASGDGGIDLIAYNNQPILSGKYIIQCKRYSGGVGEPIIRDLYGVITSERANKGILMTTGYFTRSAITFAEGKPIELIDGDKLNDLLEKYGMSVNDSQKFSEADILNIEQKFDEYGLSFKKSYNRFASEINVFMFDVDDKELFDDISSQCITLRIYESIQMTIYSNKELSEQIILFEKILKMMGIYNADIGECKSIYYKYLTNENNYKDIIYNVAMPHDNNIVGKFWLNLMTAANIYKGQDTLRNIIDFHNEYINDLAEIIGRFANCDLYSEWIKSYADSLDTLKMSIV